MKIMIIVGTRPNFVKISPIIKELDNTNLDYILVHTGQHYSPKMSQVFFDELGIPNPNYSLKSSHGNNINQISGMMLSLEPIFLNEKPDLVIVTGDVNSTLAGALAAFKFGAKIAHVEAGLRSFDRSMPEEVNRIIIDHISDYLFATEESAVENLKNEGIRKGVYLAGNVMIDSIVNNKDKILKSRILDVLILKKKEYAVLTLHRPSNVDKKQEFMKIMKTLSGISQRIKLIYPVHPRAKEFLGKPHSNLANITAIEPLGYFDFLNLVMNSKFVITDSGGIQEETTYLGVSCLTIRENTERPITVKKGTNVLCGRNKEKIINEVEKLLDGHKKKGKIPKFWDGNSARRIVHILLNNSGKKR